MQQHQAQHEAEKAQLRHELEDGVALLAAVQRDASAAQAAAEALRAELRASQVQVRCHCALRVA